jgi:hypothetical protein
MRPLEQLTGAPVCAFARMILVGDLNVSGRAVPRDRSANSPATEPPTTRNARRAMRNLRCFMRRFASAISGSTDTARRGTYNVIELLLLVLGATVKAAQGSFLSTGSSERPLVSSSILRMFMDRIRRYLSERKAGPQVIEGGLDHLVSRWSRTGAKVPARSGEWTWEEWLSDLGTRQIIQDLFDRFPEARETSGEVAEADGLFFSTSRVSDSCQWGDRDQQAHGWTPEKNWWYWRAPPDGFWRSPN